MHDGVRETGKNGKATSFCAPKIAISSHRLVGINAAAKMLGVSKEQVLAWTKAGQLALYRSKCRGGSDAWHHEDLYIFKHKSPVFKEFMEAQNGGNL